jgi:hypothetical protein
VPIGGIIAWSGTVATIPATWQLCDGTNSTPDLRDRFIVGATGDDAGVAKTNMTGALTQSGAAAVSAHSLTSGVVLSAHTLSTDVTLSAHTLSQNVAIANHTLGTSQARTSNASSRAFVTGATDQSHTLTQPVVAAHTLTQPVVAAHTITEPVVAAHTSNWPAYYALCYIQRMS